MNNLKFKRHLINFNCSGSDQFILARYFCLKLCFFAAILSSSTLLSAQEISIIDNEKGILESYKLKQGTRIEDNLKSWLYRQWDQGYLGASVDSISSDTLEIKAYVQTGPQLRWGTLNLQDSLGIIHDTAQLGFRSKSGKAAASVSSFSRFRDAAINKLENNGYPFAQVSFSDLEFRNDTLNASLQIDKGPLVLFDSLLLRAGAQVNSAFIKNYLEIRPGMPYNEKLVKRISTKVQEIPFLKESKKSEVLFAANKANLYLYLEEQKASFANGVIGLQPNGETDEIIITGQLELKLLNALKRGELFHLSWRKLQTETQDVFIKMQYPYLFSSPISIGGQLKIYKRDTTFSTVDSKFELGYLLKGGNRVSAFVGQSQANKLAETNTLNGALGNVKTVSYGLELDYQRVDYRFNPRKGFTINLMGMVGTKRIRDSLLLADGSFLPEKSSQYSLINDIQYFQALGKRMTLLFRVQGALIENPLILENEMFRIGGQRILRGFDEESVFANQYIIGTIEWRYLLSLNSRYFVFYDSGWYKRQSADFVIEDQPKGFGTGISFETKAGIFSISYALGQAFDNPILFRSAKIHFGFTSLF